VPAQLKRSRAIGPDALTLAQGWPLKRIKKYEIEWNSFRYCIPCRSVQPISCSIHSKRNHLSNLQLYAEKEGAADPTVARTRFSMEGPESAKKLENQQRSISGISPSDLLFDWDCGFAGLTFLMRFKV